MAWFWYGQCRWVVNAQLTRPMCAALSSPRYYRCYRAVFSLKDAMRHVADIPYPQVKIKLEQGPIEQTYKVAELDLSGIQPPDVEIRQLLDDEFLAAAVARFQAMQQDMRAAFARHDLR
jgi:hypothetical protein